MDRDMDLGSRKTARGVYGVDEDVCMMIGGVVDMAGGAVDVGRTLQGAWKQRRRVCERSGGNNEKVGS